MAKNFKETVQEVIERSESEIGIIIHNMAAVLPKNFANISEDNANMLVDLNSVRSMLEHTVYMLANMGIYFEEEEIDGGDSTS